MAYVIGMIIEITLSSPCWNKNMLCKSDRMRFLTAILLYCFMYNICASQDIGRDVVSSTSGSYLGASMQLDWTLGELSTRTVGSDSHIITQGFHQPSLMITSDVSKLGSGMEVNAYPNPAQNQLKIEMSLDQEYQVGIQLFDLLGRNLESSSSQGRDFTERLLLTNLPPGTYFVKVTYSESHTVETSDFGLFDIKVGNGSVMTGAFNKISWGSGDHYLRVGLDENGRSSYLDIGNSQLLSVPYAMFAGNGAKWTELENGIHYPNRVSIGNKDADLFNTNLNISDDAETDSGIQIFNSNKSEREVISIGEGDQQRYIYMAYQNADHDRTDVGRARE